jgi:hypothetical protein
LPKPLTIAIAGLGRLRFQRSHWNLRPPVAIFGKMRWRAISIIAAGAMIALSVFVFRPHPHDRGIRPPYAELISKQCAVAPENDLIPAEYSCEKR